MRRIYYIYSIRKNNDISFFFFFTAELANSIPWRRKKKNKYIAVIINFSRILPIVSYTYIIYIYASSSFSAAREWLIDLLYYYYDGFHAYEYYPNSFRSQKGVMEFNNANIIFIFEHFKYYSPLPRTKLRVNSIRDGLWHTYMNWNVIRIDNS